MAVKTSIVDDLDGSADAISRVVTLEGVSYSIDLTDANFLLLKNALKPFLEAGRVIQRPGRPAKVKGTPVRAPQQLAAPNSVIRAWASSHGVDCPVKGKIPLRVLDAYNKAHSFTPPQFTSV